MAEEVKGWNGPTRRRAERFDLQTPLDVTILRSGIPDTVPGRTVDASENGLAAMLAGELTPGETVGIQIHLPVMPDPLRARAKVKYQDKLRCGLEFLWLSAEERAAIRDCAKGGKIEAAASPGTTSIKGERRKTEREIAKQEIAKKKRPDRPGGADDTRSGQGSSGHGASDHGSSDQGSSGKKSGNTQRRAWIFVLLVVLVLAIGATAFWWRWNRGWEELESGLKSDPASAADRPQAQVAAEVMEKLLIHRVEPVYPVEARRANVQGVIALDIVVGRDGAVANMRALNGPDVLARAAMDALRWWKFEPYRVNGEPAAVETTVAVEFKQ
jgi:TonB family protein